MHQVSIAFQTDKPLTAYGALAAAVESYGFDVVSVYSDLLYQPPWLPLLMMAQSTRRIRLGVAAVNPFTCHPLNIAGNIALLDELSNGRAYLGLARGSWLDFLGVTPPRPPRALREAFACVRHLLRQSRAPLPGTFFPLAGGDSLRWTILRPDLPLLLGAWGEQTIRACLPYVAEIKLGGTTNPRIVKKIRALLDALAVRQARDPRSIHLVVGAVTVTARNGADARALAKRQAALYLPVIARLDPTLDLAPELLARVTALASRYDFDGAGALISDELLSQIAFAGTPAQVASQAQALFAAGAARVEFGTPHGITDKEGIEILGEQVLPALQ
jgi:5,10-methylenetetrahydromethanopterin reductase